MRILSPASLILTATLTFAQTPAPPAAVTTAAISGTVKDKATGAPLKDFTVSTYINANWANGGITMTAATKQISSTTDEQGHYKLSDIPPAQYQVRVQGPRGFAGATTRIVTTAGRDLEGIDFGVSVTGTVAGKIVDENKEPLPNMTVFLVSKEYYLGSVGYFLRSTGRTNDLGEYSIANVEASRNYYLVAEARRLNLPAHSEVPLNPQMRRQIPMRTWYPSSPDREGAAPLQIRPGEHREGVDIQVRKSVSYCVSGIAATPNGPTALNVSVEPLGPSSGVSSAGGMFMSSPSTTTGADGEFRFCELYPGSYRLTASERNAGPNSTWGITAITVADRDLADLRLSTTPGISLDAEAVLEGAPPPTPITVKPNINLTPLLRTQFPGEKSGGRPDIPGTITLSGLLLDTYGIRATVNSPGLYIKDVTYGDRSVQYSPLQLGTTLAGTGLRVTIAQDGATLTAKVTDKDGNPVADTTVIAIPAGVTSEGVLAARIVSGPTDQLGQYKSDTLPPGKYYVLATRDSYDMTPESIGKLWQSHTRYQEVELAPKGTAQVNLQPTNIQ